MATLLLDTGTSKYAISTDGDPIEPPLPPPGDPEQPLNSPPIGEPLPGSKHYGYGIYVSGLVYNVTSYGAVGDGLANDTAAVRAAVAACKAAGGGHVYFPAGTYILAPTEEFSQVVRVDFGNVAFVGDGSGLTELRCFAWNMQHPQNEVVENKGFGFRCGINNTTLISNIVFAGLFMNGQTEPNSFAGGWQGTLYATDTERWAEAEAIFPPGTLSGLTEIPIRAVGWDINHKAVATWGMTDRILVTDCDCGGWRGEILYSGGDRELGRYYIAHTNIWNSNGSATSIGHRTIYDYVNVWAVYNGVENFCRGISLVPNAGAQGAWLRNCDVQAAVGWPGESKGAFDVVYLGFRDSWLTIEDSHFGPAYTSAVFLSEYAHNVTIRNNTFEDVQPIHMHNLSLYTSDPTEERYAGYTNILVEYNVCTNPSGNKANWLTNYSGKGVDKNADWRFLHNTVTGSFTRFFNGTACTLGEWRIDYNDLSGVSQNPVSIGSTARRPTFVDNILPVTHDFDQYSDAVMEMPATYPIHRVGVVGSTAGELPDEVMTDMPIDRTLFPEGFRLIVCREAPTRSTDQGAQVIPGDWNSLTRGYCIYRNSKLTLALNPSTLKFDFVSYIPPDTDSPVLTDTIDRVRFKGKETVTLNPTSPVSYTMITGLAQNVYGLIYFGANVTIVHQPGVLECPGGVDFSPGTSGVVTAFWDGTKYTISL